uniref:Uncharacterized protein n=1 Tax=Octopus bimaculoides TaxID=37653 RepID=A0A0L8HKJ0_OCTBM
MQYAMTSSKGSVPVLANHQPCPPIFQHSCKEMSYKVYNRPPVMLTLYHFLLY